MSETIATSTSDQAPERAATRQTRRPVLLRAWDALSRFERVPAPYPSGLLGRIGLGVLAVLVVAYTVVLSRYAILLHEGFHTAGEDLGIMDQVLWTTSHGHFMYESICNPLGDTNCLAGTSRFAIHFEPILIPLSLLYRIILSVETLLVVQVAVVASGAIPAYLLAARRLRHVAWGLVFAVAYLAYPSLLSALVDDFHPETLTAAIVMWALYFLWLRRDGPFLALCMLALLCKETLTLDVFMIGLFVAVVQRRPRLGLSLAGLALFTLGVALTTMHFASPLGQSSVAGRLAPLKHAPVQTLLAAAQDPARQLYLARLLAPLAYLPLLAPWVAVLALPAIALNAVSTNAGMYSGLFQYNTDIAALLLMAAIDGLAWLLPLAQRLFAQARTAAQRRGVPRLPTQALRTPLLALLAVPLVFALGAPHTLKRTYMLAPVHGTPTSISAHDTLGQALAARIPQSASVSAQALLVPHVSERLHVYQFPYAAQTADYVFLDVSAGNTYPYDDTEDYEAYVNELLRSGRYTLVAAQDGYLLLQHRAASGPPITLPASFYTFVLAHPTRPMRPMARFANALDLVGFDVSMGTVYQGGPGLVTTTYWRVTRPLTTPLTVVTTVTLPSGTRLDVTDSPEQDWFPPDRWPVGAIIRVQTWPMYFGKTVGNLTLGAEVRTGEPSTDPSVNADVPVVLTAPISQDPGHLLRLGPSGKNVEFRILPAVP